MLCVLVPKQTNLTVKMFVILDFFVVILDIVLFAIVLPSIIQTKHLFFINQKVENMYKMLLKKQVHCNVEYQQANYCTQELKTN